jgi:transposase
MRDKNASANILDWGILKHSGGEHSVGLVELPTLVGTMKQENLINIL